MNFSMPPAIWTNINSDHLSFIDQLGWFQTPPESRRNSINFDLKRSSSYFSFNFHFFFGAHLEFPVVVSNFPYSQSKSWLVQLNHQIFFSKIEFQQVSESLDSSKRNSAPPLSEQNLKIVFSVGLMFIRFMFCYSLGRCAMRKCDESVQKSQGDCQKCEFTFSAWELLSQRLHIFHSESSI